MARVEVVYALEHTQDCSWVDLPAGSCAIDAVRAAGILVRHPEIDLTQHKLGIYGKVVAADAPLADGDRVEIYRPLVLDPKEARRRRALRR
jgi:hypothetical protein